MDLKFQHFIRDLTLKISRKVIRAGITCSIFFFSKSVFVTAVVLTKIYEKNSYFFFPGTNFNMRLWKLSLHLMKFQIDL